MSIKCHIQHRTYKPHHITEHWSHFYVCCRLPQTVNLEAFDNIVFQSGPPPPPPPHCSCALFLCLPCISLTLQYSWILLFRVSTLLSISVCSYPSLYLILIGLSSTLGSVPTLLQRELTTSAVVKLMYWLHKSFGERRDSSVVLEIWWLDTNICVCFHSHRLVGCLLFC